LISGQVEPQIIPTPRQHTAHQALKEAVTHEQIVPDITAFAEAKVPPGGLVELVNMPKADQIVTSRPSVQRLQPLHLVRGQERHGLGKVLPDELV